MNSTSFRSKALLALALACIPPGAAPAAAGEKLAARVDGTPLTDDALCRFVGHEYRHEARAQELLQVLVQERLVAAEAARRGISISAAEVEARRAALDAETARETGGGADLDAVLEDRGVDRAAFLDLLATTLLAERLARDAFEIPESQPVPYEKTALWLQDRLARAALRTSGLPAEVAAEVDGEPILLAELGRRYIQDQADRRRAWQEELVDAYLVDRRAAELGIVLEQDDLESALERRRQALAADPRYLGTSFDELLAQSGRSAEWLRGSLRLRAQLQLERVVKRLHPGDRLERYYDEHRQDFDRLFGPAVRLRVILLKAGHEGAVASRFVPRLYADAEAELLALSLGIASGEKTFAEVARTRSEHPSRSQDGDVGFVRESHRTLGPVAAAVLASVPGQSFVGPVRVAEGACLAQEIERGPRPTFAELEDEVVKHAGRAVVAELRAAATIEYLP